MGSAKLGNYSFRLDPTQIAYSWQINQSTIDTLGGQVIQVLGATISDLTVTISFGQDHANNVLSWQMAENFATVVKGMMDNQTLQVGQAQHTPITFSFLDGTHNWNFLVLIKGVSDPDGTGSVHHSNGKYSHSVQLTLFPVSGASAQLEKIAQDDFISSVANGVGWQKNSFNGQNTLQDAIDFIQKASPSNPTFDGYLTGLFQAAAGG